MSTQSKADYLKELGNLGITARIKRLSDVLSTSIRELYRDNGMDIEPSWHLVLLFLKGAGCATVTQMAASLHISQPAMTAMIRRMKERGYLEVATDTTDSRRRVITLSAKAKNRLPAFERVWEAGQATVAQIFDGDRALMQGLEAFEAQIAAQSFHDRVMAQLATEDGNPRGSGDTIKIKGRPA